MSAESNLGKRGISKTTFQVNKGLLLNLFGHSKRRIVRIVSLKPIPWPWTKSWTAESDTSDFGNRIQIDSRENKLEWFGCLRRLRLDSHAH